jgi:adenylate cyclase
MVVDDDAELRRTLVELIRAWGYAACEAHNGRAALTKLASFTPELVLLDLVMPDVDGWAFVDAVAHWNPKLNILVLTANHPAEAPPGYPVLRKPMAPEELKKAVELNLCA